MTNALALIALLATPASNPPPLANGSFKAEVGGRTIHYEVHGQGPVLMTLTNSWGLTLEGLRGLYRPLEERLTLVYFDPRGMGASSPARTDADRGMAAVREDFDALRRHLKIEKANVIGWSNGAMNLQLLAAEHPQTIESAIFLHGIASNTQEDMLEFANRFPDMTMRFLAFQKQQEDPALSDDERTARQKKFWMEEFFPFLLADPRPRSRSWRRRSAASRSARRTRGRRTSRARCSTRGRSCVRSRPARWCWPARRTRRRPPRSRRSRTASRARPSRCSRRAGTSRRSRSRRRSARPCSSSWEWPGDGNREPTAGVVADGRGR